MNYGKSQKEICEFKAKITEITENMAIESAKAYIFHVQLIAPDLEVKTKLGDSDEITHKIPMKSREKTVECKTKPDKIQGKLLRDSFFFSSSTLLKFRFIGEIFRIISVNPSY